MATASRHASGPHGSGATLEDLKGWRAFVHLARELKLARLARLAYPYRRRAVFSVIAMIAVTLSGGQRQRIAIARALVMDPRILILDDATSSVDVETEFKIRAALTEVMRGRTTFIIAHRPSTISLADEVVVLDHGHIEEHGTHAELMAAGGLYAQMFGDAEAQHCDLDAVNVGEPAAVAGGAAGPAALGGGGGA